LVAQKIISKKNFLIFLNFFLGGVGSSAGIREVTLKVEIKSLKNIVLVLPRHLPKVWLEMRKQFLKKNFFFFGLEAKKRPSSPDTCLDTLIIITTAIYL